MLIIVGAAHGSEKLGVVVHSCLVSGRYKDYRQTFLEVFYGSFQIPQANANTVLSNKTMYLLEDF
jgi:hypothetical protein